MSRREWVQRDVATRKKVPEGCTMWRAYTPAPNGRTWVQEELVSDELVMRMGAEQVSEMLLVNARAGLRAAMEGRAPTPGTASHHRKNASESWKTLQAETHTARHRIRAAWRTETQGMGKTMLAMYLLCSGTALAILATVAWALVLR